MTAPPPRVRVTAPRSDARPLGRGTGDASALYVRSLIRSQLRLAIVSAVSFAVVLVGLPIAFALLPELAAVEVGGVPLGWIAVAVGIYPVVLLVAALFVRAADRNEQRYRSLADDS